MNETVRKVHVEATNSFDLGNYKRGEWASEAAGKGPRTSCVESAAQDSSASY